MGPASLHVRVSPFMWPENEPDVYFIRSDASRDNARIPALSWRGVRSLVLAFSPSSAPPPADNNLPGVCRGSRDLPCFRPRNSAGRSKILLEADALAIVDSLTDDAASSPLMQRVHQSLLASDSYLIRAPSLLIAHVYGDADVAADRCGQKRGIRRPSRALCAQLHLTYDHRPWPTFIPSFLDSLARLHHTTAHTHSRACTISPRRAAPLHTLISYPDGGCPPPLSTRRPCPRRPSPPQQPRGTFPQNRCQTRFPRHPHKTR